MGLLGEKATEELCRWSPLLYLQSIHCRRRPHIVPCKSLTCLILPLQVCAGKSKGKQQMKGGRMAPPQRPEIPTPDVDEANAEFVLFARNTMVSRIGLGLCEQNHLGFGASQLFGAHCGMHWLQLTSPFAFATMKLLPLAATPVDTCHHHQGWQPGQISGRCSRARVWARAVC